MGHIHVSEVVILGWGAFLASISAPLVRRVLLALGFGLITFAGLSVVESQISSAMADAWGGVGGDVYAVLALGGWVDAVGIWLSAVATVVAWMSIARIAPVPGAAS